MTESYLLIPRAQETIQVGMRRLFRRLSRGEYTGVPGALGSGPYGSYIHDESDLYRLVRACQGTSGEHVYFELHGESCGRFRLYPSDLQTRQEILNRRLIRPSITVDLIKKCRIAEAHSVEETPIVHRFPRPL